MRLLQLKEDGEFVLVERAGRNVPPYAILSHTWGTDEEEVTFKDLVEGKGKNKAGYRKLRFCGEQAAKDSLRYFWVDTCCIDKSSSSELSEAVNSMFRWYQESARCYVYLSDVSTGSIASNGLSFRTSRWFTRGWTLQELLAPKLTFFYSAEGALLGDKDSLAKEIAQITGITVTALQGRPLQYFSIEERMSWAERRETKREEDLAYSLLGIFNIYMSLIYGEGKENALKRLQKEIQDFSMNQWKQKPKPSLNVPYNRDPEFVERTNILAWVNEKCTAQSSRAALVGLGGVGKSQIAIQHCYNIRAASPHTWVFWVHAGTQARFEEGYRRIAEVTKMDGWDNPKADILRLVRSWLCDETNGRWVMVVDNADDSDVFFPSPSREQEVDPLSDFLPQSPNGSILITSRSRDVAFRLTGSQSLILEVKPMEEKDALALLERKLGFKPNEDDAVKLLHVLGHMPLAITQAAAYIAQRAPRMSVSRYLGEVSRSDHNRSRLLGMDVGDSRRDGRASNSIIATWQISFEHIRRKLPSAAQLLSLMSLFDRQGIPERLLYDLYDGGSIQGDTAEGANFEDDIHTLTSFSLVEMSADGSEFEMHRLVQFTTKQWLEMNQELEQWNQIYVVLMDDNFPVGKHENWAVCQELFPHARAAEGCKPEKDAKALGAWASVLFKAAWYSSEMGQYDVAKRLDSAALKVRESLLGADHPDTLDSLNSLAMVLNWQGAYADAEIMHLRAVEASKRVLGAEHPDTLTSIANLAWTYRRQGRFAEAEQLQLQVLEMTERVLGAEHPDTLHSISGLASTYRKQGRWAEAEKLDVQVTEARKNFLGAEHPDTLTSISNLASAYRNQGRWAEAEKLDVQVMEARKRVLGVEHPDTLTVINNLALTYGIQGRRAEAEKLQEQLIATSSRVLGAEHPHTLTNLANLALTYENQGRWTEAEKLELQVLEIRKKVLGAKHPDTLSTMSNLASTYRSQGRWTEAENLEIQVLEARKSVFGAEYPDTLMSISNLASTYRNQGRWVEAEELQVPLVETCRRVLGAEHPHTLTNTSNLALTYGDQGRWTESEKLEVQILETRKRVLGAEHPDTLTSMANLALTYGSQSRWTDAENLEVQVREISSRTLGAEHPDTLNSIANLASTYRNQGRLAEAEELQVPLVETSSRVLGAEHPNALADISSLALTYANQDRLKEAENLELQVLETRKRVLGAEHPDTLGSIASLAPIYRDQGRLAEAEELQVQLMETNTRVLGAEHPDTLNSIASLALTQRSQGRLVAAEALQVQVVETRKRLLGAEHPDTLTNIASLASNYREQGRLKEAEELQVPLIETRKRVLGAEHPDTLSSIASLASTYAGQDRLKEAEVLRVQVLETRKRVFGAEHSDTLYSMSDLAHTIHDQGRIQEAISLMESCVEIGKQNPSSDYRMSSSIDTLKMWQTSIENKEYESDNESESGGVLL